MVPERLAMIPHSDSASDSGAGGAGLVTDPARLLQLLGLDRAMLDGATQAQALFPLKVPLAYVRRMRQGDPRDPLLLQVLGGGEEARSVPGFSADPLAEADYSPLPGVLQKYRGRVLLMATGACGVHCRYCFRRHFPYAEHQLVGERLDAVLDWLGQQEDVEEVILSGGDPLVLSDRRLAELLDRLGRLPNVQRLRIHSRQPVVDPSRVTPALLATVSAVRQPLTLVLHCNHPQELDDALVGALARLRAAGVTLLNQSVLLAGVNDELPVLADLSRRLFAAGVLPYYLHQLDPVAGAAHFAVPRARALSLHEGLRASLSGYLVPRLVEEVPGDAGKRPVWSGQ